MYLVEGFDSAAGLFDIILPCGVSIRRSTGDLKSLARKTKKLKSQMTLSFPSHLALKLQDRTWCVGGEGWHANQSKALANLNAWLNSALSSVDDGVLQDFMDEARYEICRQETRARIELEASARKLQQYFASSTNIQSMLELLRRAITSMLSSSRSVISEILLVEPSFGDGRLLRKMLDFATSNLHSANLGITTLRLLGIEIDPVVSAAAISRAASSLTSLPQGVELQLLIHDFLQTTSEQLAIPTLPTSRVIVVGSPPYTIGGGTGDLNTEGSAAADTGRDLPLNFLVHSAAILHAHSIIFLMPQRCSKPKFLDRALQDMQTESGSEWVLSLEQPADSVFDFVGRQISQPVVIQVYDRH